MSCKNFLVHRIVMGFTLLLLLGMLTSCKKKEEAPAPAPEPAAAPAAAGKAGTQAGESDPQSAPQHRKRKVIVTRAMSLEVKNYQVALDALTKLAESSGGYLFKSNRESAENDVTSGEVGLRVPAMAAGAILGEIAKLGKISRETGTAEDITEGYVDLEARINNTKASEARLLSLYKQAGDLSDVLEVERELTRVRGDIEAFEAKRKNWDLLVEMATIEIRVFEPSAGLPSAARLWNPLKSGFGEALKGFADSLHALIVFLGAVLPWAALFAPLIYFWARRTGRQSRHQATTDMVDSISSDGDTL